ncbi:MAG: FAD-dependent oxidoreductase [Spirochaetales bacterium]|nr:FAD-dependent oxidoreductase [Spirochaetales bacterium]MCF7938061.1 FAD-dependent oxidoreductase [Spirochaetales bacterium]
MSDTQVQKKIQITIDNKEITAEEGKTILEVASNNGIKIPTLCHNGKVSKTTSCFVCMVKDTKSGKFLPSCSSLAVDGMVVESDTDEVSDMRQTALNLLLSEHSGDCEAPCTIACPAHANVEEYVRAGREGKFLESLKIIKERIPLPLSISRICPRFCEQDCRRNTYDGEAVAINDFKRISGDLHYVDYVEDLPELNGKKVAVVGAGPAGYSTAYFLRKEGIASDLFDKQPEPGGMLRYGIPEYRLPKKILDTELAHFEKLGGISVTCNTELGKGIRLETLKKDYDAVVVAVGSWKSSSMRAEGEEHAEGGIGWLEKIALAGWTGENPGKTIVIGGGDVAMDCVRTSLRLGSRDVSCFYRRTENEMPATPIEVEEAKEEGVHFEFLTSPVKLREENGKKIMTCIRMELGEPDASGRRRPVPVEGSEYDVEADTIIAAIGQKTTIPEGIPTNKWGEVETDGKTFRVEDNVFSTGDCQTGPATVVESVAGARLTAQSIAASFNGTKITEEPDFNVSRGHWQQLRKDDLVFLKQPAEQPRTEQRKIPMDQRLSTMNEVWYTFTKEEIMKEGERCLECSCTDKGECKLKEHSETYGAQPDAIGGEKLKFDYDTRHPEIIMDPGKCIKCGICVKTCREIINKSLLDFKFRGYGVRIGTAFGEPLPQSCRDCGECIEACPVGALGWRIKK